MKVVYLAKPRKQLAKLDNSVKKRILDYMDEVANLSDPRSKGKMLVGDLKGFWRYRVGDYRLICRIHDEELEILVVEVGHRKEIYD
ncbi:MAG: type II toxin-antitoxin system RelE/ParE family toxin [Treponema sp.]|nr:type II toxin-antitoxin system RelE/ParE family toxin [Treponema sp.]MDE6705900.1 type II toxin-antitoxin system RelE/ParE family toxin [Treponemataceae bacterium]